MNHVNYRCLMLSFVHLLDQNKVMAERYAETAVDRNATLRENIAHLASNGYLNLETDKEADFLVSALAMVVRFWTSEAKVSFSHLTTEEQIKHYLILIGRLLRPYSSAKGKKEIRQFLKRIRAS